MNIIRCPIHGSIHFNDREKALIDNPFFQRLRFVSQLGFANLVYPGAVHNRFSHSLGAMHLAGRIFEQLSEYGNTPLNNFYSDHDLAYFQQLIRFTALLHDIGHPPFSHTAESVLPLTSQLELPKRLQPEVVRQATHEDFSIAIVYKLAQKPYQLLSKEEANDIIVLLKGEIP
ncbi:MAG: HD superfamily phosphohydrolase, partial [bacterium]